MLVNKEYWKTKLISNYAFLKLSNVCLDFQRQEESLQYSAKELNGQCIIEKLS